MNLDAQDRTGDYDYERLIAEEKEHFAGIEVTEALTEGGVHAHGAWQHYWMRVGERIAAAGYADVVALVERSAGEVDRPLRVLSLGSGYCGHELALAARFGRPSEITCTDINEALFERARGRAREAGYDMRFECADLNFLEIAPDTYDLILAHASLHHVINLELLYDRIAAGLTPSGVFHLVETVGQNRRLLWAENEAFVNRALRILPRELRRWARIKAHEEDGMEGVRAEEIVPLLRPRFATIYECAHGAFMRPVCTHRKLGKRLDPRDPERRKWLDLLIDLDAACVQHGVLRALEVWGLYRRGGGSE